MIFPWKGKEDPAIPPEKITMCAVIYFLLCKKKWGHKSAVFYDVIFSSTILFHTKHMSTCQKKKRSPQELSPNLSSSVHLQKALVPDPVLKARAVQHSPALPGAPLYSLCSLRSLVSTIGFSSGSGEQGAYPSMVGLRERDGRRHIEWRIAEGRTPAVRRSSQLWSVIAR